MLYFGYILLQPLYCYTMTSFLFTDFSLDKFMEVSGISDLKEFGVSQLLEYLGVSQYLQQCDRTSIPYKTSVNGWNNGMISFYKYNF